MKRIIVCAVLLIIPLILSVVGCAKESKAKSFSIQFMNKTIPLRVAPEKIKSILKVEQVSPDFNEKEDLEIYVFKANEIKVSVLDLEKICLFQLEFIVVLLKDKERICQVWAMG